MALSPEVKKFADALQAAYTQDLKHTFDSKKATRLAHEPELKKRFGRLQAALRAKAEIREYVIHAAVALVAMYLVGDDAGTVQDPQMSLPGFESPDSENGLNPNDPESVAGW